MSETAAAPVIVLHNKGEKEVLKHQYLESLGTISSSLREVVRQLYDLGVAREELVQWAVVAGYSQSFVRSLLSKLFCGAGKRKRKAGAGRHAPLEALV